jgi:hypothetical protein
MVVALPKATSPVLSSRMAPLAVRWDPDKRDDYRDLLSGEACRQQRASVLKSYREGALTLAGGGGCFGCSPVSVWHWSPVPATARGQAVQEVV